MVAHSIVGALADFGEPPEVARAILKRCIFERWQLYTDAATRRMDRGKFKQINKTYEHVCVPQTYCGLDSQHSRTRRMTQGSIMLRLQGHRPRTPRQEIFVSPVIKPAAPPDVGDLPSGGDEPRGSNPQLQAMAAAAAKYRAAREAHAKQQAKRPKTPRGDENGDENGAPDDPGAVEDLRRRGEAKLARLQAAMDIHRRLHAKRNSAWSRDVAVRPSTAANHPRGFSARRKLANHRPAARGDAGGGSRPVSRGGVDDRRAVRSAPANLYTATL